MRQPENQPEIAAVPLKTSFKVIAIITMIANFVLAMVFISVLPQIWNVSHSRKLVLESGAYSKGLVLAGILFLSLTCLFGAFGAYKMLMTKRTGFVIYCISNGLWVVFGIFLGSGDPNSFIYVAVSILFIAYFAMNRKVLN